MKKRLLKEALCRYCNKKLRLWEDSDGDYWVHVSGGMCTPDPKPGTITDAPQT